MMDLEIADYERTVEALNSKVTERDATITELRSEVERLEEKARGLKEQIGKISRSLDYKNCKNLQMCTFLPHHCSMQLYTPKILFCLKKKAHGFLFHQVI